jgi:hypothetical protein
LALRKAATLFSGTPPSDLPESFGYSLKRRLLGPPMVNEELRHQRLSKVLALGVLSPDGISSSAYGTEEMLIELLPLFGLAAFAVILPMTGVILFVMTLVVLSYREVVTVYTRAGGSYVVARENFGPRIAQVAAVALLIDYVVTVAVQVAGGTAAVVSAIPVLGTYTTEICVGVVLIMCYGNLRGIREAGKAFALPTYLFTGVVILMIVLGLVREVTGNLHAQDVHNITGPAAVPIGSGAEGVALIVVIFTLMRSFANGGSSLTGIEAVSNAVSAAQPGNPAGGPQLRARLSGHRRHRRDHRALLRAHAHPGRGAGGHDPASRPGRHQGRRRRDGQPRLRTPAVATASRWPGEPPAPSRSPGREGAGQLMPSPWTTRWQTVV